jgi:hypothetical protein
VAALTIPAVVQKVTKEQYVTGLKKAYNTIKAVEREAIQEYGEPVTWSDWSSLSLAQATEKYFIPYFDIMKNCGNSSDKGCWHNLGSIKYLNGTDGYGGYDNGSARYRFITSDGMFWVFAKNSLKPPERIGNFQFDVNGKKAPNIIGRDIFEFEVFPNKGIAPAGAYDHGNENTTLTNERRDSTTSIYGCSKESTNQGGWMCAAKVLSENAMNY